MFFQILGGFILKLGWSIHLFECLKLLTDYCVLHSTATNATSQFHRPINRRAAEDGRSDERERGGTTAVSSQHPAPFGCRSYSDVTVLSCSCFSICCFKVECNSDSHKK